MNRREFLASTLLLPRVAQSLTSEGWRIFEIRTHVHVQNASGVTRAWLPTPAVGAPYQQTLGDTYSAENGRVVMVESEEFDLLLAEWPAGADPVVELTSRIATRAHAVDLMKPSVPPPADLASLDRFLRPTRLYATDGTVRKVATDVTRGAGTDIDKARAIFSWASSRSSGGGCGLTEPQCADRHALFVAVCRAAGVPARAVYGLGVAAADATSAQRSRAEVYLVGFGWVPLDATSAAFGSWDGNWVAFNAAQDVVLPKAKHAALPFFMHPQAETANGFANSLDATTFRYEISVRESR